MQFGTAMPAANTLTKLAQVPAGLSAVVNLNACNTGVSDAKIRFAISSKEIPDPSEYYEWDANLSPTDVLERTALSLSSGYAIFVYATTSTVAFNAHGEQEVA